MVIEKLTVPTLLVDEAKVRQNVKSMIARAKSGNVRLRPHFKTHQSINIAEWMRQEQQQQQQEKQQHSSQDDDIYCCTVSSLSMAASFAKEQHFKDITVAFPFNIHEIQRVYDLLKIGVKLGLTIENEEAFDFLFQKINMIMTQHDDYDDDDDDDDENGSGGIDIDIGGRLRLWIKVDAGYHRTGVRVEDTDQILKLLRKIQRLCSSMSSTNSNSINLIEIAGILIHGGHSYDARGKDEIIKVHQETLDGISKLRNLFSNEFPLLEYSVGDTPSCSTTEGISFDGCTEIRPGNYVFYDVEQSIVGSCTTKQIAVCLACPVVAKHIDRNQIVLYGGAVHLSKDNIQSNDGKKIFGLPVSLLKKKDDLSVVAEDDIKNIGRGDGSGRGIIGWSDVWTNSYVTKVSQEHGIIQTTDEMMKKIQIGDFVGILPVHSCLTADCMGEYMTLDGNILDHFRSHSVSLRRR